MRPSESPAAPSASWRASIVCLVRRRLTEQAREVLPEQVGGAWRCRIQREAAIADHQGGDALQRLLLAFRFAQTDQIVVAMRIDESRCYVASVRVENVGSVGRKR